MGQMVRHEMQLLAERTAEVLVDYRGHLTDPELEGLLKPRLPPIAAIGFLAPLGVERVSDVVDIPRGQSGGLQTVADRAFRDLMRFIEICILTVLDEFQNNPVDGG